MANAALRRFKTKPNRGGAPLGNVNAARAGYDTNLHIPVLGSDKGTWTDAANLAVKEKRIEPDARGNLATWVRLTLNAAADRELKKPAASKR